VAHRPVLAAALLCPALALNQTVATPPNPTTTPSSPAVAPTAPIYQLPPLANPIGEADSAPIAGEQIFVKRIEVKGVSAFKPRVIAAIVAPYQKRVVTSGDLQTLRVALARLYTDKGYVNSVVLLPEQAPKDGVVVYQAIEGTLTKINVTGKSHLSSIYVTWRIRDRVDDPLNIIQLQDALKYLQTDANIQRLDARLAPGDAPGQSVLQISVDEQPRFAVGAGVDDHHTSITGETEGTVFFEARDLTGYGDDWRGSVVHTQGDTEGSGAFSIPVTANSSWLQLYYSRSSAGIIQQPFQALNIKETTRAYGLSLTEPIIDHTSNRFAVFVGAESDRSYTELLDIPFSFSPGAQNGVSEVAVVLGGIDWLLHGASSVTDLRLTYRRGIDALGATINNQGSQDSPFDTNPTGADGRFGLEQLQFIFIQRLNGFSWFSRLNDRAQFIARASGQWSQQPLMLLEKFAIGGVDTVRGFPENLIVRDDGTAATLEVQLPVPGYRAQPDSRDVVVAAFVDYGRSWDKVNTSPDNPLVNTTDALYIASAGVGVLWNPLQGLDAQMYWGRSIGNNFDAYDNPLNYAPNDLQKRGVHYSVNYIYRW
jgi:hemolysin activation/secretion protein